MKFNHLFIHKKPVIGCIHLPALPGAPRYGGMMDNVYQQALLEAKLLTKSGLDGLIIENFNDKPFYPDEVPAETIASLAAVGREIIKSVNIPVGINVLRNDARAALAIATAINAHFIRVNVHMNAVVSDQGIIQGNSHETIRLREYLHSNILIFADAGVKHAAPLAPRSLAIETRDLCERGMADAVIVSGELTGLETNPADVEIVKKNASVPVLIGSGVTPKNLPNLLLADGFIVGSYFKKDGNANNSIEESRVSDFMEHKLQCTNS